MVTSLAIFNCDLDSMLKPILKKGVPGSAFWRNDPLKAPVVFFAGGTLKNRMANERKR